MNPKLRRLINNVNRSMSMMTDEYALASHPIDSVSVKASEIPEVVKEVFLAFLEDYITVMRNVREGDGETFDPKAEMELAYSKGTLDGDDVYWMGVHDPGSPFNPSGYDYYVRADGTLAGVMES